MTNSPNTQAEDELEAEMRRVLSHVMNRAKQWYKAHYSSPGDIKMTDSLPALIDAYAQKKVAEAITNELHALYHTVVRKGQALYGKGTMISTEALERLILKRCQEFAHLQSKEAKESK